MKVLIMATVLLLAGCASMQNTPAQDAAWEKLNRCPKVAGAVQVNTDGSWHVSGERAGVMAREQCWNEQKANNKARPF